MRLRIAATGLGAERCWNLGFEGRAKLAERTMFSCSPAKPPVCAASESSFSPMMCTFWRCFCGERLRRASSLALSSQSGRPGRRWPPGPPGRKLGRRGADGAVGRATGGVAVPAPALVGASGRRGAGAVGRPTGFCSCMSSPGATGLRIPAGIPGRPGAPGRVGAPGRPLPVVLPSRRIGFPTSSRVLPLRGGIPGRLCRVGAPGLLGPPWRWGTPVPAGRRGTGLPTSSGLGVGRDGAPGLLGAPARVGAPDRVGAPARMICGFCWPWPGVGRPGVPAPAGRGVGRAGVGAVGLAAALGLLTSSGLAAGGLLTG